ncbi:hydrophobic surface binding protein A-domain-containing protein [Aspergillus ambiguus]|uniref:cell wall mannoprotein 1 family protein n=1 Tax=Aspergillus ambiguus TaxID=176160 RepID=UPI003CCD4668
MRFSALFTLGLATVAIATPTKVQRDAAPVESVISAIQDKTEALGTAINGYSGGDTSSVESASSDLISTIKSGVETVNSNGDLTSTDALALTSPVQDLTKKVESVVNSIIDKKSQFVSAGAGGTVLESLKAQYAAAQSLSDAISSKVPSSLSDLAAQLSAGITDAIQKGIDAYKDAANSGSSSSTSSAEQPTSTATGGASTTGGSSPTTSAGSSTTSSPVIPSGSSAPSSSSVASTPAGSSAPMPTFTGAASKAGFSVGGALAAAAIVAAF